MRCCSGRWGGRRSGLADGTEIAPQLDLRFAYGLFAGVRPIRAIPGVPGALADPRAAGIDLVILRESTEGMFASRGKGVVSHEQASDTLVITRDVTARLARFACELALRRKESRGTPGRVTLVDKANVFRSFAFMREVFLESVLPGVEAGVHHVDAMALDLVRRPWDFDVLPMENLFGDILSDLGAGLIGGMGFAPSGDIGAGHGLFQPSHGDGAGYCGTGDSQSDGGDLVGGDDAGVVGGDAVESGVSGGGRGDRAGGGCGVPGPWRADA